MAGRGAELPGPLHPDRHESAVIGFLHDRTAPVVASETAVVRDQFRRNGVGLLMGDASFVDEHTIAIRDSASDVAEVTVTAEHIVIAVGPSRRAPPAWTSTSAG